MEFDLLYIGRSYTNECILLIAAYQASESYQASDIIYQASDLIYQAPVYR